MAPSVGQDIAAARRAKKLSQTQLATAMSVHQTSIGRWERDEALPPLKHIKKLAGVLDLDYLAMLEKVVEASARTISEHDRRVSRMEALQERHEQTLILCHDLAVRLGESLIAAEERQAAKNGRRLRQPQPGH